MQQRPEEVKRLQKIAGLIKEVETHESILSDYGLNSGEDYVSSLGDKAGKKGVVLTKKGKAKLGNNILALKADLIDVGYQLVGV